MNHIPVSSTSIASVGHDPTSKTLEVCFTNGSRYAFTGVSADEAEALLKAKSIGAHFSQKVRGKFDHTRLDVPAADATAEDE